MPILIVLRHGKAEPHSPTGADADRTLRERGRGQAAFIGEQFADSPHRPSLILYSTLARAAETASIVAEHTGAPLERLPALELGHEHAGIGELLDLLGPRLDADDPLMIVGHNTQLENLCSVLVHGPGRGGLHLRTGEAYIFDVRDTADLIGSSELLETVRWDG